MDFLLTIEQTRITCEQCRMKPARSRMLFQGAGVTFYVRGAIGKRFDQVANVALNKMIELGHKAIDLRTV